MLKGYFRSYISERNVSQVFIPFCGLLVFVKICKALYLHILTGHLTDFQFVILVPAPDALTFLWNVSEARVLEAVLTSQLEVSGSTRCEMFGQGCLLCEAKVCQGCSGNLEKIKYCYGVTKALLLLPKEATKRFKE